MVISNRLPRVSMSHQSSPLLIAIFVHVREALNLLDLQSPYELTSRNHREYRSDGSPISCITGSKESKDERKSGHLEVMGFPSRSAFLRCLSSKSFDNPSRYHDEVANRYSAENSCRLLPELTFTNHDLSSVSCIDL